MPNVSMIKTCHGAPGVRRKFQLAFDPNVRHMSNQTDSEIRSQCALSQKSGIRMAVRDGNIADHRWWRRRYQTSETVHLHAEQQTPRVCLLACCFVPTDLVNLFRQTIKIQTVASLKKQDWTNDHVDLTII